MLVQNVVFLFQSIPSGLLQLYAMMTVNVVQGPVIPMEIVSALLDGKVNAVTNVSVN